MLTKEDDKVIEKVESFLRQKRSEYGGGNLWIWALKIPQRQRIEELFEKAEELDEFLKSKSDQEKVSVLDLGCGFCTYWPIFQLRGCNTFVGIDLFDARVKESQSYQKTANEVAQEFCSQSEFHILSGDVRDIDILFENHGLKNIEKFDIIFTKNTDYTKMNSTGIPEKIFDSICDKWLKDDGKKIYAG